MTGPAGPIGPKGPSVCFFSNNRFVSKRIWLYRDHQEQQVKLVMMEKMVTL